MFGEAFSRASFSHLASWTNVSRLEEGQREKERKKERERESGVWRGRDEGE